MSYKPTIGLEIHTQLKTQTKMFCDSWNIPLEEEPNKHICAVCTAQPGSLPVANEEAIKYTLKAGLSLNCKIQEESWFERKNYFYPDLPKGYQISQYERPFCYEGFLNLPQNGGEYKKIRISRIHLEEDTGKLIHSGDGKNALVDFNRAGIPLMEMVTEPDISSGKEARRFAETLRLIFRYLDIADADMEKGQMRVEVNISIAEEGERGTKVEIKNLNSFRSVEKAVDYEIERQAGVLEKGEKVIQETRGWDEDKSETLSQRIKEEARDYRYFPEPDLPTIKILHSFEDKGYAGRHGVVLDLEEAAKELPELPAAKEERFIKEYNLSPESARTLVIQRKKGNYFEAVASEIRRWEKDIERKDVVSEHIPKLFKLTANYLLTEVPRIIEEVGIENDYSRITPENFGEFVVLVHTGAISSSAAQKVLAKMYETGGDPSELMEKMGLRQVSDKSEIKNIVKKVINDNHKAVEDYKNGNEGSIQFLVGQVMKESRGKANPQVAREILSQML